MWYVYVLVSDLDNKFYVGLTENLNNRLSLHSTGKVSSTKLSLGVVSTLLTGRRKKRLGSDLNIECAQRRAGNPDG